MIRIQNTLNFMIVSVFSALIIVGWDWAEVTDRLTTGKIRYSFMCAALLAAVALLRANPYAALFAAWGAILWIKDGMLSLGVTEALMPFMMLFIATKIRERLTIFSFVMFVSWLGFLEACYAIVQALGYEPFFMFDTAKHNFSFIGPMIGTIGHRTALAPFVGLSLCFFASRFSLWRLIPVIVCAVAVAFSHSVMGILSTMVGLLYLVWRSNKKLGYILSGSGVLAIIALKLWHPTGGPLDLDGRQFLWPYAFHAFMARPLTGFGPGTWAGLYPIWGIPGDDDWRSVHMDYLEAAIQYGIVGLGLIVSGLIHGFLRARSMWPVLGSWLTLIAFNALANFPMELPTFGLVASWLIVVLWMEPCDNDGFNNPKET